MQPQRRSDFKFAARLVRAAPAACFEVASATKGVRWTTKRIRTGPGVTSMIDETKLNAFMGKILSDLGGAFSAPLVRMGDKLGLYKALNQDGRMTPGELSGKDDPRRTLRARVAVARAGVVRLYFEYEPVTGKFTLPPEQAMVFAEPDSPVYLIPAFDMPAVMLGHQPLVEKAFSTGKGVGLGDQFRHACSV